MKKITLLSAIAVSSLFYTTANAQIGISLGLHLPGVRIVAHAPVYTAPVVYDDYYYLPEVDAYYSVAEQCYYYNDGENWISAAYLPGAYRTYDWRTARRVEVHANHPYMNADFYRSKYRGNVTNWSRNDRAVYANRDNNRRDDRERFDNRNYNNNTNRNSERMDNRSRGNYSQPTQPDRSRNYSQPQADKRVFGFPGQPDRSRGNNSQPVQPDRSRGNDAQPQRQQAPQQPQQQPGRSQGGFGQPSQPSGNQAQPNQNKGGRQRGSDNGAQQHVTDNARPGTQGRFNRS